MYADKFTSIHVLNAEVEAPREVARRIIAAGHEEPFYVMSLDDIIEKLLYWREKLPRVTPFYAMKANNHPHMLKAVAALGAGFDCASRAELRDVLALGVPPERIIYANPTRPRAHIRYSRAGGVFTATFDNETELLKIKELMPEARLVLRFCCDALVGQTLGNKFGCDADTEGLELMRKAQNLGLNVVGVSFHVGSDCREPMAYSRGIKIARKLFDAAATLGVQLTLLDVGGGYPGDRCSDLDQIAAVINWSLEKYFPDADSVDVIAEPGRYLSASAFSLFCNIHSKRVVKTSSPNKIMLYINDGVYCSFNRVFYKEKIFVEPLEPPSSPHTRLCSIWGPSCDGVDCVMPEAMLPASTDVGDWLLFPALGTYSLCLATTFNGFEVPLVCTVVTPETWRLLKSLKPFLKEDFMPWCSTVDSKHQTNGEKTLRPAFDWPLFSKSNNGFSYHLSPIGRQNYIGVKNI